MSKVHLKAGKVSTRAVCGRPMAVNALWVLGRDAWQGVADDDRCRGCQSRVSAAQSWVEALGLPEARTIAEERRSLLARVRELEQTAAEAQLELRRYRAPAKCIVRNWSEVYRPKVNSYHPKVNGS